MWRICIQYESVRISIVNHWIKSPFKKGTMLRLTVSAATGLYKVHGLLLPAWGMIRRLAVVTIISSWSDFSRALTSLCRLIQIQLFHFWALWSSERLRELIKIEKNYLDWSKSWCAQFEVNIRRNDESNWLRISRNKSWSSRICI